MRGAEFVRDRDDCTGVEEMSIGENIRRARQSADMTQAELAKKVCVSQAMICSSERGSKACSMGLGLEIARALGCKVSAFYDGGEEKQ